MKKIFGIGVVMFFLFTISCFAGSDAVYERNRPQEIKGWSVSGSDDKIGTPARLMTELDSTYAQLSAEDKVEIVSSSHRDSSQTVIVSGINNSGNKISENIALVGTNIARSLATFRYIDQVTLEAGTNLVTSATASCLGTVTVRKATGDTFIVSVPIGSIEATVLQHFNGEKDSYVTNWGAAVTSTGPGAVFDLRYYSNDASCLAPTLGYKTIDQISLTTLSSSSGSIAQPIKCPAGGWIAVYATGRTPNMDNSVIVQGYDITPQ
jgi:hypothetical protein